MVRNHGLGELFVPNKTLLTDKQEETDKCNSTYGDNESIPLFIGVHR